MAYQQPSNPAAASGPGAMSQRTDGGPLSGQQPAQSFPGAPYGDRADFASLQAGAPMSAAPDMPMTPLGAATERPGEPVTTGAPFGAGAGPESMAPPMSSVMQDDIKRIALYLPALMHEANQPDTPKSFRAFVQYVKGMS